MKITILGAGAGGFALAADLHTNGIATTIAAYEKHASKIHSLQHNTLNVRGIYNFNFKPDVTCDVPNAISTSDIIFVVVPAFAQERYINDIINYGKNHQYVIFTPGKFGAIYMEETISKNKSLKNFYIADTATLPYATKFFSSNEITIKAKKKITEIAFSRPVSKMTKETLVNLFPSFVIDDSILKVNLIDPGPVLHVTTTLLNTSRIEQTGAYETSGYDITPSIGNLIQKVDNEKSFLLKHLDLSFTSVLDILKGYYPLQGSDMYTLLKNSETHQKQISPSSLKHRYITEEIPYHFVPMVLLAKEIGIAMPLSEALINIASALINENYWTTGRDIRSFFREQKRS